MSSKNESDPTLVKSATRTLDILELIAQNPDGLPLSDVASRLNIPLSSLYNLMSTLTHRGYVTRERGNLYRMGYKILYLRDTFLASADLLQIADPVMQELVSQTGETASLAVLQGAKVVFIHKCIAGGGVGLVDSVGTRRPAHATASGKALLSRLEDKDIDKIFPDEFLPAATPVTIVTRSTLKESLAEIRRQGYAHENQESKPGIWAVAACIYNQDGAAIAALSVVGSASGIKRENQATWHKLVISAAHEISTRLGFQQEF